MATPLYTPRVNNNDDTVRLIRVMVKRGDAVRAGDIVAEVETDKANFTVEAERGGFVLEVSQPVNETIDVGSVLLWIGDAPDEPVAVAATVAKGPTSETARPTLKAAQLLARHGLSAADVPFNGQRLTVDDIEAFIAARSSSPSAPLEAGPTAGLAEGMARPLTPEERGMLRAVLWHRDEAVPGYVELEYDAAEWDRIAADYQKREGLLLSPLLALMAYRLVRVAAANERLNATIHDGKLHVYSTVNLGFTVQSDRTLYLAVAPNAGAMSCREFVAALGEIQRGAIAHKLRSANLTGATVSFSSMARWGVRRHVPVVPPHTSIIIAHAASSNGRGTLGATYDHRVLTGFDALSAVREVSAPEELS
jgi:pyruvate/2-oxoglutarate dehydrogenase complex dihydrolipoamide acyltransferase (E2) component